MLGKENFFFCGENERRRLEGFQILVRIAARHFRLELQMPINGFGDFHNVFSRLWMYEFKTTPYPIPIVSQPKYNGSLPISRR
jgi:hypothetical protein